MSLTREQCRQLDRHVGQLMLWLDTLRERMAANGELGDLHEKTTAAYNAVHDLHIALIYASIDGAAKTNERV